MLKGELRCVHGTDGFNGLEMNVHVKKTACRVSFSSYVGVVLFVFITSWQVKSADDTISNNQEMSIRF